MNKQKAANFLKFERRPLLFLLSLLDLLACSVKRH